jgi:hypothetical protein
MIELVFNAPDIPTLVNAAVAMGYYGTNTKKITSTGSLATGGSFLLNLGDSKSGIVIYQPTGATTTDIFGNTVPVTEALPGIWGRLRHNGDPALLPTLPTNSGVALYHYNSTLGGWTSDDVTLAPAYVGDVGLIA